MPKRLDTETIICIIEFAVFLIGMTIFGLYNAPQTTPKTAFMEPVLKVESIYVIASRITGCPEWILQGYDYAESTYGANLTHPDPTDEGRFGLHESVAYHKERATKWGEYDANDPIQAAIIAGYLYMENLRLLGDSDSAICAHKQGPTGVRRDGKNLAYLESVIKREFA